MYVYVFTIHQLNVKCVFCKFSNNFFLFPVPLLDIDECADGSHRCNSSASCINTDGSFNCTCDNGYGGDGFNCCKFAHIELVLLCI